MLVADEDDVTRMRLEHLLTMGTPGHVGLARDVALEILSPSGPPHIAITIG